ncbi:hypothetical protein C8F01DRAFT_1080228 [Mycena amicta]|nr:hypothetical protein C8F01DRAFT_1080228 [Mycena amicta]
MKRTPGERTRHSPQDEKAQGDAKKKKIQKRNDEYNKENSPESKRNSGIMRRRGRTQREKNRIIFRMVLPYSAADLWRRAYHPECANASHAALSMQQQLEGMKMGSGSRNAAGTIATNERDRAGYTTAITREPGQGRKNNQRPGGERFVDSLASAVYPVDELLSRKGKRTAHYVIPDDSNPAGESDTRASIVGQAEDGVAKSIGNHADEDGDQRAEAEEQQIGQAALIRMKGQLCRGKAQQGQSIADMEDRERRRIVTLHNNSGSKE